MTDPIPPSRVFPDARLVCRHVGTPPPAAYVCVPLMAQSTALGVLHLVESAHGGKPESALGPPHALARRQQAHIASPTPYTEAERDTLEVPLDTPETDFPVRWLGRTFNPTRIRLIRPYASS